ncbi:DUF975 family protein [Staphylospora marina]|uniref:DUF975 family protein n=1 Tax=Staphylospora marina TaxID=2490858 RepID=UPI000F5B9C0B|nr:DUF975 family protein [Staphylospora marina]
MSNKELKQLAKQSLKGNWGTAILGYLLPSVLTFVLIALVAVMIAESPTETQNAAAGLTTLVWIVFVAGGLNLGISLIFLNISRQETARIGQVFHFFTNGRRLLRSMGWLWLQSIYLFLWSLLLVIPGIIKSYSYALSHWILIDHPEISVNEAITRSRKMMDGYKWKLFVLQLSFIGWFLLGFLTSGLAFFYVIPYYHATMTQFYRKLNGELNG